MQLIREAARTGFTAACTQLEGLHLSGRNHRSEEEESVTNQIHTTNLTLQLTDTIET